MDVIASLVDRGSHSHHPSPMPHMNSTGIHMDQIAPGVNNGKSTETGQNMLVAWIVLQLAGQVTLPILIATLLFHKRIARRNPTVINLCIVWTLATIPPELLFYANKWKGSQPSPMLCLFQASTISAVPPMAAMAYLSVVIHACTVIHEIISGSTVRPFTLDLRMILLLSSPYISFLTFALFIAIVGAQYPKDVHRDLFFCEVKNHGLSLPVFAFTVIIVVFTLISQFWIAIMFYRNYLTKRKQKPTNLNTTDYPMGNREVSAVDIQLLIRMVAFTVFEVVIVVSSVASMFNPRLGAAKLLLATPPFAVFLIFASSRDIFKAWFPCFFRRSPKSFNRLADTSAESTPEGDVKPYPPHDPSVASPSSRPPSLESQYSQTSIPQPPPAKTKAAWSDRDQDVDLEKGLAPSLRLQIPSHPREGRGDQTQEHSTTMVVHGPNSSSPQSPLNTIRALRTTPAGPRLKPRYNQI